MKKIAIILADGFEEVEALAPFDILKRAGFDVDLVSINDDAKVESARALVLLTDLQFDECNFAEYDALIIPGGQPGTNNIREYLAMQQVLKDAFLAGKLVAAICAAPLVLADAGILAGRRFTCYRGVEKDISIGTHVQECVVVDDNLITASGAGAACEFAFALVDYLGGDSRSIRESISVYM